jgi:acyl-CoA synthetase (AMP-forming)/AMP-acid ligase II
VEDAVAQHPAVYEVAVVGVADSQWGEAVHAVVVLEPECTVDASELIAFCRTRIAAYKCPKFVSFVAGLPRLNTGKVDKVALRGRVSNV